RRQARARRRPRRLRARLPAPGGRAMSAAGARKPGEGGEGLAARAEALELDQPSAPYLDALVSVGFRGSTRFHVPGHKGGPGADPGLRHAIREHALAIALSDTHEL